MSNAISGRLTRAALLAGAALSGLLLAGCSSGTPGTATAAVATTSSTASTASAAATGAEELPAGEASGDPTAIRTFTDPATEIVTADDLAEYLLPGMSGAGVDCATAKLDPESVLSLAVADGAYVVSNLVASCVERPGIGELVAMYAVGFAENGADRYADLAACASDAFGEASGQTVAGYLREIYTARLDLAAPATSPDIAAAILADDVGCGAQSASNEAPESQTESSDTATPEAAGSGQRTVHWTLLQAGDCMVTMPADDQNDVQLADCATPHEAEVIGRSLAITGTEEATCIDLFADYVGQDFETATWLDLAFYTSTDTFQDPVLVCFVHAADDPLLTASVEAV